MRRIILANKEIYHVYNRGVDKRKIYLNRNDYQRFVNGLVIFNTTEQLNGRRFNKMEIIKSQQPLVNIISYCLMPNHFHLLLEQRIDQGIPKFIHKMNTSFTMYFNKKYKRSGVLFQGVYKCSHIRSNPCLLEISKYIHTNPIKLFDRTSKTQINTKNELLKYQWSSFGEYAGTRTESKIIDNTAIILEQFKSPDHYIEYVVGEA